MTPEERDCLERYVALLGERLGDELEEVILFGSAARGDMWPEHFPIRSDIDVLVLSRSAVAPELPEELIDATYPLFLECGRQIGPQFRTRDRVDGVFGENVERDGVRLWPA